MTAPICTALPHLNKPRVLGTLQIPRTFLREKLGVHYGSEIYTLILKGTCMEPEVHDGDSAIVSPTMPYSRGDFVALWPKDTNQIPQLKRVVVCPPPGWQNWHPDSDAEPLIIVETLNPAKRFYIPTASLAAIHRVAAWFAPGTFDLIAAEAPSKRRRGISTPPL